MIDRYYGGEVYQAYNADERFGELIRQARRQGHDSVVVDFGSLQDAASRGKMGRVVLALDAEQLHAPGAAASLPRLAPEQVDTMVDVYTKRRLALNAETTARTAALQAQKLGQRLAWDDAINKGVVDRARLMKKWIGVNDSRERPTHVAMNGTVAHFDEPFLPIGQMTPGEDEYNCRCLARYFLAPAA
jgi:hypothetical protein